MNLSIRPESLLDIAAIESLTAAAFLNAPHTSHAEQFIVSALRQAGQLTISLLAELEGVVIGHVAAAPVTISDGTPGWFGLGPLSVLPLHQRRGVGSRLMLAALDRMRRQEYAGCVVLGEPEYYGRFGFRTQPGLILPGVPPPYFQAIRFAASWPCGTVSYSEAFNAAG